MRYIILPIILFVGNWMHVQGVQLLRSGYWQRSAVAAALGTLAILPVSPSLAASDFINFHDESYHASFQYPSAWIRNDGQISGRRAVTAFVDPNHADTSVSIVYSPIAADFTKLGSLGGKDALRLYLVPQGNGVTAEVLDERTSGDTYFVEYLLSTPSFQNRHIQSILALRPSEAIVGLTVQVPEDVFQVEKDTINAISKSLIMDKD
eukprot:gene31765-38394_t